MTSPRPSKVTNDDIERLLDLIRKGRDAALSTHVLTLIHHIANAFEISIIETVAIGRAFHVTFTRPLLHLRGFGQSEFHLMILTGGCEPPVFTHSPFHSHIVSNRKLPFLFACSDEDLKMAAIKLDGYFVSTWAPADISHVLAAEQPLHYALALLRKQFPIGLLHPFAHQRTVEESYFCGRHDLLKRLRENPDTNYALIGPSRIGKSSLIKKYQALSRNIRSRRVYLDLFRIPTSDEAVARAIRMKIDSSASSYYDTADKLLDFLEKAKTRHGGPFEIILDETDKHIDLQTIQNLIHAADRNICRLILIGRWRLMHRAIYTKDQNFCRLEPIIVEALTMEDCLEILMPPLAELGMDPYPHQRELKNAVRRLGRVAGMIQEFGSVLVRAPSGKVSPQTIQWALDQTITTSRLDGLLEDLSSTLARVAALTIALHGPDTQEVELSPSWLQDKLADNDIRVRIADCKCLCDELVIHHLITLVNGSYRMARWDIVAEGRRERAIYLAMIEDEIKFFKDRQQR